MRRLHLDLVGMILLAAVVLFLAVLSPENIWLRSLLSVPLALYGVGYAVGVALFPSTRLGGGERLLLSLGLSISILILTGLFLNMLVVELQSENWAWILFLISTAAALLGMIRRWLRQAPEEFTDRSEMLPGVRQVQAVEIRKWIASPLNLVMVGLVILTITMSVHLALKPAPTNAFQGYSMFWMAPDPSGTSQQVELGVRSMEFGPLVYSIELYDGGKLVERWDDIQLDPKQEWTFQLEIDEYRDERGPLEALLYRADQPNVPYRQVRLWPTASLNLSTLK